MTRRRGPTKLLRDAYRALGRVDRTVEEANLRLTRIELAMARLEGVTRALAADERGNRARLETLRAEAEYERAWTEPRPLVSVTLATVGRDQLTDLALPSILGQSYGELEVIVAGDEAATGTEERVRALGDERVRYLDLGPRTSWTDDPRKQWLVGATRARNAALKAATGRWIVHFDDDDAMRPECLESLLELARQSRAEAVYGRILSHGAGAAKEIGVYPPRENQFSWVAGLHHAGLRFLEPELLPAEIGVPGDWWLAERMLRAGVRFAMRERVLCDVYPSDRRPED